MREVDEGEEGGKGAREREKSTKEGERREGEEDLLALLLEKTKAGREGSFKHVPTDKQ